MSSSNHVHVKRRSKHGGALMLVSKLHQRIKRHVLSVLSRGSALRGRAGS